MSEAATIDVREGGRWTLAQRVKNDVLWLLVSAAVATIGRLPPRALRAAGLSVFATIDAGPHLKCLVRSGDASAARESLERVPGVLRIIETAPGEGARIVAASGARSGSGSEAPR